MLQHDAPGPPLRPPLPLDEAEGEAYPVSDKVQLEVSLLAESGAPEPAQQARPEHEKSTLTLLVVDDEPDMRAYVKHCLGPFNAQVIEATDGAEALAKARQGSIDLIISDVVMPHLDGLGLYRALQAEAALLHIPVLLITGAMSAEEVRIRLGLDGAPALLEKPFNTHKLCRLVEHLLPGRPVPGAAEGRPREAPRT